MLPVIEIYGNPEIQLRKQLDLGTQIIPLNKIVAVSRKVNPEWDSMKGLLERLKIKKWREHTLKYDPIEVHELDGKYFVYNGNHRASVIHHYQEELGITHIPARVRKLLPEHID